VNRILVAGVGNIFKGDDGFGVEVAQRLAQKRFPKGVNVVDFGIRGIDLTYALLDGCDAAILVDTAQRGVSPGTVTVIEPDQPPGEPEGPLLEPHNLDPAKVLALVAALGGRCRRVLLVACEPATFGDEEMGAMGLSPPVAAAVAEAVNAVERLVNELTQQYGLSDTDSSERQNQRRRIA
jgi:hydrogenase maturation protease